MKKIDKIFGDKKASALIYIIMAVGILMLAGGNGFLHSSTDNIPVQSSFKAEATQESLRQILSEIDGVGEVSVMLCRKSTGAEKVKTSKSEDEDGISGVLIVAEGGEDAAIREKIIRATKAALGVDPHKIEVLERNV